MTAPATNAPRASDAPNSSAAPMAVPRATARIERTNSSCDRVCAIRKSSLGISHRPTNATRAMNATALSRITPSRSRLKPSSAGASAGIKTRMPTVRMSSMTSQPTAACPAVELRSELSIRLRNRTTVLATEIAMPTTTPAESDQPLS